MEQQALFFEDVYDALRHVVQASGGAKKVGSALFPEKTPDAAGRYLMDCLNSGRAEKICPEQLLALLRIAHSVGCNAAINFICHEAGYDDPSPLEPEQETVQLQRQILKGQEELKVLYSRMLATRPQVVTR